MEYQSTSSLDDFMEGQIKRSPKIRIITLFRMCRADNRVSLIGDYLLALSCIGAINKIAGRKLTRWELRKAVFESEEFKGYSKHGLSEVLDEWMTYQSGATAQTK